MVKNPKPVSKQQLSREARRKIVEISAYMFSPMCPEHTKKELEQRIKSLSVIAYE
jgi:hypothetical protein